MAILKYPGEPLSVQEDNGGVLHIYRSGNSACRLCWTVANAIHDLGVATDANVSRGGGQSDRSW